VRRDGRDIPCHAEPLAHWPDGSVRWALLDVSDDLAIRERAAYTLEIGDALPRDPTPPIEAALEVAETPDAFRVTVGVLQASVGRHGAALVRSLSYQGRSLLAADGTALTAEDDAGNRCALAIDAAEVEERNPLRVVLRARGRLVGEGGTRFLAVEARLTFLARLPAVRLVLTFTNDLPPVRVALDQLRFRVPLADRAARIGGLGSYQGHEPRLHTQAPLGERIGQVQVSQHWHWEVSGEEKTYRTNHSHGWAFVAGESGAVALKLRRPKNTFPKGYWAEPGAVAVDLYPRMDDGWAERPAVSSTYTHANLPDEVTYDGPLLIPQGTAFSHEVWLLADEPGATPRRMDARGLALEQPLLLELPDTWYAEARAFPDFSPYLEECWPLEAQLRRGMKAPTGIGMLHDGDDVTLKRVNGRVVVGTTENVSYEKARSYLLQWARTGWHWPWWWAEMAVNHLIDVDTVHFSTEHPEWVGGPRMQWSQNHAYWDSDLTQLSQANVTRTWVGALVEWYLLTGSRRALETAVARAHFCARCPARSWPKEHAAYEEPWQWDAPRTVRVPRQLGWALYNLCLVDAVSPEPEFDAAIRDLVDVALAWQNERGQWAGAIGTYVQGSIPFMEAGILNGLLQAYRRAGEARVRDSLLRGARYLCEHVVTRDGLLYYKEAPITITHAHPSNIMLMAPLRFAYEESGDRLFLDRLYRFFRWMLECGDLPGYNPELYPHF
jgi:hypothetical protein